MSKLLCPSLMCADFRHLADEVEALDQAGVDIFHCDIMDGTFVPNFTMGVMDVKAIRQCTKKPIDCHLMIEDPANKVDGVRCCVCSEPYSAKLSKMHNNSNIIAFGARVVGVELAKMIVEEWLNAEFEGGRHQRRVDMIMEIQDTQELEAAK